MGKTIAVIATLDTKGQVVSYVKQSIERLGHKALIIDVGVNEEPAFKPDISREKVSAAAGIVWDSIKNREKRDRVSTMMKGIEVLTPAFYARGKFSGIFSVGGLQNTTMGTAAMKVLPIGVPKLMLSTMASGLRPFGPFVGTKDITLMHSVGDILGVNVVTKPILDNAVGAIVGMVEYAGNPVRKSSKLLLGCTMFGVTNDGVSKAVSIIEEKGVETVTFHANGTGGPAMEELIEQGLIHAVMDLTLHEIDAEFYGGYCSGAKDRLIAAAKKGIPQVVALGAADVIDYEEVFLNKISNWQHRKRVYQHPTILHIKLDQEEATKIGGTIADRLNMSMGPVTLIVTLGGFHQSGYRNGPLWDPVIDQVLVKSVYRNLKPSIKVIETDAHINDYAFSKIAADELLRLISA